MMKRIAIVHPFLGTKAGSGSIYKCLKIIEALKDFYKLDLITGAPNVNFSVLNRQWETNIVEGDIRIKKIPLWLLRYTPQFMALRHSLVGRYCRAHAHEYDVMLSAYNPYDFGVRGIQFIGDLIFSDKLRVIFHAMPKDREASWFYKDSWGRALYLKVARFLYPAKEEGLWRNLTISNSHWTRDLLYKVFGVDSVVVYPPVPDLNLTMPWARREEGFVTIGNLVPFKQIERSIRILRAVRGHGFNVHFHLIGDILDQVYADMILGLCRANADWCFYEGPLYGRDKMILVEGHKYGIHGAQVEGFGISVAEMVKAGCVVWVAEGGGQTEIVESEQLIFRSEEDAVRKILAFRSDKGGQDEIRHHLAQRSKAFILEKYFSDIRHIVDDFISRNVQSESQEMAYRPPLGSEMIGPINRAVLKTWFFRNIPAQILTWFHGWRFVWLLRRMKQDPEIVLLGALVSSGDVTVDVGANGANWTWFLSRAVGQDGRVFAFEADPYYAQATYWAIRHMRLKNVTMFPFGLSNQMGTGWLRTHDDKGRRLSGTGFVDKDHTLDLRNTPVGLVTLDSLVGEHQELMKTRLVKADVEGHELFVFQGAETIIRTARPALVFETGDNETQGHRARNLWRWLKERSYEIWAIANDRRLVVVDDRLAHPDTGSVNRIALPTERLKDYRRTLPFRD